MMRSKRRGRVRPGFSILEAVVSSALVGVLLVAAMRSSASSALAQRKSGERAIASTLADDLLAEITRQQAYENPTAPVLFGPEPGETGNSRALFNDVDDYNAWIDSPPQTKQGTLIPNLSSWTRVVKVDWVQPSNLTQTSPTETGLKRITVSVTHNSKKILSRVAMRSNAP